MQNTGYFSNIQGKFGDVNDKIGSGLRVPCFAFQASGFAKASTGQDAGQAWFPASPFRLRRAGMVQRLNKEKGAKQICKSERWNICNTAVLLLTEGGFHPDNPVNPVQYKNL